MVEWLLGSDDNKERIPARGLKRIDTELFLFCVMPRQKTTNPR